MSDITQSTIDLEVAIERLRQERETFELRKNQSSKWFGLRLAMGYTAVFLLPGIAIVCGYIVVSPERFGGAAVTAATSALLVDVLGLIAAVWKIVFNPESGTRLEPVTATRLPAGVSPNTSASGGELA